MSGSLGMVQWPNKVSKDSILSFFYSTILNTLASLSCVLPPVIRRLRHPQSHGHLPKWRNRAKGQKVRGTCWLGLSFLHIFSFLTQNFCLCLYLNSVMGPPLAVRKKSRLAGGWFSQSIPNSQSQIPGWNSFFRSLLSHRCLMVSWGSRSAQQFFGSRGYVLPFLAPCVMPHTELVSIQLIIQSCLSGGAWRGRASETWDARQKAELGAQTMFLGFWNPAETCYMFRLPEHAGPMRRQDGCEPS